MSCSLIQVTAGSKLMGCISVERFSEPKMGSGLLVHVTKGTEFDLPPALS